jgi:hypothetical protein
MAIGCWAMVLAGFAGLAFYLMKPNVAGFLYDDGMYLMVAKALATGEGYRLSGIVGDPYFHKYPPLYPLLLAFGWILNPHFPENIAGFKSLNILISMTTLGLWGYYFQKIRRFPGWLSLLLVAVMGTHGRFLEVSTELMSDPLFMMLGALILILCHWFHQKNQLLNTSQTGVLILLSVAAFYTRTMAIPLIAGIGLWLWFNRQHKQALFYGLGSFALSLPWLLWSGSRKDTTYTQGDFLVRTFQETYFQSFRMDLRYEYTLLELVSKGANELLGNLSVQFLPLLERFFLSKPTLFSESLILIISFALALALGRYAYLQIKNRQYSPEGLYVGIYLAILPFWSFYKFYPRFIMPLLPLLLGFLVSLALESKLARWKKMGLSVILMGMIGLNVIHLTPYLQKSNRNALITVSKPNLWADYQETFQFINKHTRPNSRFYIESTDDNYFFALNTHRPVFDFFVFLPEIRLLQSCPRPNVSCLKHLHQLNAQATKQVLDQQGASYIVGNKMRIAKNEYNKGFPGRKAMPLMPLLLNQNPQQLKLAFQTKDGLMTVYHYNPAI